MNDRWFFRCIGKRFAEFLRQRIIGKIVCQKVQNRKNTDHIRHIVIGDKAQNQRNAIGFRFSCAYNLFNAQNHKREQIHSVKPHHIPIIRHKIAAKRIQHAECRRCRVVLPQGRLQIVGKSACGKHSLNYNHRGNRFGNIFMPKQ